MRQNYVWPTELTDAEALAILDEVISQRAAVEANPDCEELEDAADVGDAARTAAALARLTPAQVRATDSIYIAAIGGFDRIIVQHAAFGYCEETDFSRLRVTLPQVLQKGNRRTAIALLICFGIVEEPEAWLAKQH